MTAAQKTKLRDRLIEIQAETGALLCDGLRPEVEKLAEIVRALAGILEEIVDGSR